MSKNISQKIAIIAILLISFFGMNLEEGKAACPAGYNMTIRTITISGCQYKLEICYQCSPTQNTQKIYLNGYSKVDQSCVNTLNDFQVLQQINGWLQQTANIASICTNIIPCGEGALELYLYEPVCWKYVKQDSELWIRHDDGCGDAFCYEEFTFCYNTQTNSLVKTFVFGPAMIGTPSCFDFYTPTFGAYITDQFLNNTSFTESICFYFPTNKCGYPN